MEVAVSGDGAGGIVGEDLVRRIQLVRDWILWPARHHEQEQGRSCPDDTATRRGASAGDAGPWHRTAFADEPLGDKQDEGDAQEELVAVLRADSTVGRRDGRVDGAQRVAEALRRRFAVVADVAPAARGGEIHETGFVEMADDLRAVHVHEHLHELALGVVDRDRPALDRADAQREHVDPAREVGIQGRQVGRGILSVGDHDDRLRTELLGVRRGELRSGTLQRGAE